METHPGDQVILHAYDRDGYLILKGTARPVIDVMTAQTGLIGYESCYAEVPDCKPVNAFGTQSFIRGEARVNRIGDWDPFKFRLVNVPQTAKSVAVVPLLDLEQQGPEPDELVEGTELIRLDDGSYGMIRCPVPGGGFSFWIGHPGEIRLIYGCGEICRTI